MEKDFVGPTIAFYSSRRRSLIRDIVRVRDSVLQDEFSKSHHLTAPECPRYGTILQLRHDQKVYYAKVSWNYHTSKLHTTTQDTGEWLYFATDHHGIIPISEIEDHLPKNDYLGFNDKEAVWFDPDDLEEHYENVYKEWEDYKTEDEDEDDEENKDKNGKVVENRWKDRIGATRTFNDQFPLVDADLDRQCISTSTSFRRFRELPTEVRLNIWKFAVPRRLITIILRTDALTDHKIEAERAIGGPGYNIISDVRWRVQFESSKVPGLFYTCYETYKLLEGYTDLPGSIAGSSIFRKIRINLKHDILYFHPPVDAIRTIEDEDYPHILEVIKRALPFKISEVRHLIFGHWCYTHERVLEMLHTPMFQKLQTLGFARNNINLHWPETTSWNQPIVPIAIASYGPMESDCSEECCDYRAKLPDLDFFYRYLCPRGKDVDPEKKPAVYDARVFLNSTKPESLLQEVMFPKGEFEIQLGSRESLVESLNSREIKWEIITSEDIEVVSSKGEGQS
ncbi:hypothetical protein ACMFMG_012031 [Clarireedia jacksonii]